MFSKLKKYVLHYHQDTPLLYNIGFLVLRIFVGLALCTIFEKFFPKDGIWGPQTWFIEEVAEMGFPLPVLFAWIAVLTEFFGGLLLIMGLFTRPAAILNTIVTFVAAFIYHKGDIAGSGLTAFFFMVMCICISLFGGGKFSLDYLLHTKMKKKVLKAVVIIPLLLMNFCLNAQDIPASELKKIEGKWEGILTYTDYGDDVSQSMLNCKLDIKWKKRKAILTFKFIEPDGREIKDKTNIKLRKKGTVLIFDGPYQVLDFDKPGDNQDWKLTIGKEGKENNKNADLKQVVNFSKHQLLITKLVKYKSTEFYFERNRYSLERAK